jgi:uncharacterized membrane protein YoaK (UPF0700 family)
MPAPSGKAPVEAAGILELTASFAVGCVISAFITRALGLGSVLVPAVLIGSLAVFRREQGARAHCVQSKLRSVEPTVPAIDGDG